MTEFTNEFMTGRIYWAKIFRAVPNYDRDGYEWTYDFVPDDAGIAILKKHRLLDRLKEARDPIDGDYIHLKKASVNAQGQANEPFKVYDENDQPWEGGNIGNGSVVDLALTIADFGKGKKKAIWTTAIRVVEHVPHEGGTQSANPFSAMEKAPAKKAKKAETKTVLEELDDLDDELPFDMK